MQKIQVVMARTINEISTGIKEDFIANSTLQNLYGLDTAKTFDEQFSAASLESIIIFIIAAAMALHENLWDLYKSEIDNTVQNERYGYAGWYARMMKAFQFGFDINELEEKDYYDDTTSDEAIEAQIIKFAFCEEKSTGSGVLLKIAKADADGNPTTLTAAEETAAAAYINRIKPAGVPVTIVNDPADTLSVTVQVRYNPLVFTSESDVNDAVRAGIESYLKGIDFNGSFIGMKMIDALQVINGIEIAQISSVAVTHAGYDPEDITSTISYTPVSGYMLLNELNITKSIS